MLELYVKLMCQYLPAHVRDYVETIREGDLRLQEVIPAMEKTGVIDAAIILEARSGRVRESMNRLTGHLSSLQGALRGLLTKGEELESHSLGGTMEDLLSSIERYSKVGIWLCQGQSKISQKSKAVAKSPKRSNSIRQPLSFDETLWLDLVECVVAIARDTSQDLNKLATNPEHANITTIMDSSRQVVQQVFTALLTATTTARDDSSGGGDITFLRILRAFLSNAAKISPSLSELRSVISSIFAAYAYEESLLSLSNAMLDKDVFVDLDDVKQLRLRGWRPRGQVCEVCRRRVWGPGVGEGVWQAWQRKEEARSQRREKRGQVNTVNEPDTSRGKGKAAAPPAEHEAVEKDRESTPADNGPIVVFSCRHVYHQKCLSTRQGNEEEREGEESLAANVPLACPACIAES